MSKDCKCKECLPKRGERGPRGYVGPAGKDGIDGNQGAKGDSGNNGQDGQDGSSPVADDTGWWDLIGMDYYNVPASLPRLKPQARRINNIIYFRGEVIVPIEDPSNPGQPLEWTYAGGIDTYLDQTDIAPFTGPGGVSIITSGSLRFNLGANVLPPEVITGFTMEVGLGAGFRPSYRSIRTAPSTTTILGSLASLGFSKIGTMPGQGAFLVWGLIRDAEESIVVSNTAGNHTSSFNNCIAHVREGEFVPKYSNVGTTEHSSPLSGVEEDDKYYDPNQTYPFSCNANLQTEIGGFRARLDGITIFVE